LTSPIVISVYLSNRAWDAVDPSGHLCTFFGFSMTVFGLSPLFIASAMAVERTLALRAPHCFFAPTFAVLGLLSLVVTVACNLATIEALVSRCRTKATASHSSKQWGRIAMETLIQLLGIMCVLSACWSPLLIMMLKMIFSHTSFERCRRFSSEAESSELHKECNFFLTAVRLASLNQILDPWVYLLLRKILLQKFCQAANAVSKCSNNEWKERSITLSEEIRRTAA
ncbi:Prostaglandin E2 receptor EP3 subtype, partial [Apaloderma vittatum]